jgi:hypothetical protein
MRRESIAYLRYTCARTHRYRLVHDVAIRAVRQAGGKRSAPRAVFVVDRDEAHGSYACVQDCIRIACPKNYTSVEGNLIRGGRDPVCYCSGANGGAPANHACNCDPAVLAEPSNKSTQGHRSTLTSARTSHFARCFRCTYQCLEDVRAAL